MNGACDLVPLAPCTSLAQEKLNRYSRMVVSNSHMVISKSRMVISNSRMVSNSHILNS